MISRTLRPINLSLLCLLSFVQRTNGNPFFTGDHNAYCCFWAAVDECYNNPVYMRTHCQKSCGTLGCKAVNVLDCRVRINTDGCPFSSAGYNRNMVQNNVRQRPETRLNSRTNYYNGRNVANNAYGKNYGQNPATDYGQRPTNNYGQNIYGRNAAYGQKAQNYGQSYYPVPPPLPPNGAEELMKKITDLIRNNPRLCGGAIQGGGRQPSGPSNQDYDADEEIDGVLFPAPAPPAPRVGAGAASIGQPSDPNLLIEEINKLIMTDFPSTCTCK